jgi:hypothetical protein
MRRRLVWGNQWLAQLLLKFTFGRARILLIRTAKSLYPRALSESSAAVRETPYENSDRRGRGQDSQIPEKGI